ncbi:MAG: PadR family transcriptional regulator [Clostridia bacterium]
MKDKISRKIFLAFIEIRILALSKKEPFFGAWLIEEFKNRGYGMSAGTLYPILHGLEENGLIESEKKTVAGKSRKYYVITKEGKKILKNAKAQIKELEEEI